MPAVELHVHAARMRRALGLAHNGVDEARIPRHDVGRGLERDPHVRGCERSHDEDRRFDAVVAQLGGRRLLPEAVELRRHGIDAPILVMGALTAEDARAALEAPADVVAWEPAFADGARARRPTSAACTGPRAREARQRAWAGSARRTPEQALAVARTIADGRAPRAGRR